MEQQTAKQTVDTHVRFPVEQYDVIRDVATENHIKISPLIRHSVGRNLEKYLQSVRVIDKRQADELLRVINELNTGTQMVRLELKRIGINIDQQTKVIHDKKKELEALSGGGYEAILEKQKLMKEIAECEELSLKNQLESRTVINEYDRVLSEVGEQLWHIQK